MEYTLRRKREWLWLSTNKYVVNWNEDETYKVSNKAENKEAGSSCHDNLIKLYEETNSKTYDSVTVKPFASGFEARFQNWRDSLENFLTGVTVLSTIVSMFIALTKDKEERKEQLLLREKK